MLPLKRIYLKQEGTTVVKTGRERLNRIRIKNLLKQIKINNGN